MRSVGIYFGFVDEPGAPDPERVVPLRRGLPAALLGGLIALLIYGAATTLGDGRRLTVGHVVGAGWFFGLFMTVFWIWQAVRRSKAAKGS